MGKSIRTQIHESLGAVRGVFTNREIRRVQFAFGGSVIGSYAYVTAVAVFAFRHGGPTAVGVFTFIRLGVAAVVAPVAASISDRFRRERVMIGSDLLRCVTVSGAAAAVFAGAPSLVVYALATLTTVFGTVFRPAEAALVPTLARSPQELTAANLSSSTFDSFGLFAGPALGALLLVAGGPGLVFCVTAGTFLWSAVLLSGIHTEAPARLAGGEHEHQGIWGGVRAIRAEPRLRLLIGLYGAQCVVAGVLGVLVVATALDLLSMGSGGVGLLDAMSGVGALVGAAVVVALVGRKRLAGDFGLGLLLWGLPLALLGTFPHTAIAVLALAVVGAGNTIVDVSAITLLQRTAPTEVAGRVFGVLESMLVGALGLGALLAPALIAVVGIRGALIAAGLALPLLTALCWPKLRVVDAGAAVPDDQLAAVRGVPFLSTLPLPAIEALAMGLERLELAAGEVLFEEGAPGDRFYIVTEGAVEIDLPDRVKTEVAPCYVGEIALLRDIPRTATVRGAAPSVLWAVGRDAFLTAVVGHARSRRVADEIASARLGTAMDI